MIRKAYGENPAEPAGCRPEPTPEPPPPRRKYFCGGGLQIKITDGRVTWLGQLVVDICLKDVFDEGKLELTLEDGTKIKCICGDQKRPLRLKENEVENARRSG